MKQELQAAYKLAQNAASKINHANKNRYNQKVRYHSLSQGDRVLIRNLGLRGKQKLADRWNSMPYVVESQLSDLLVYRLRPVGDKGPVKVIHRNHIEIDSRTTPSPRALRRRKAKEKRILKAKAPNTMAEL